MVLVTTASPSGSGHTTWKQRSKKKQLVLVHLLNSTEILVSLTSIVWASGSLDFEPKDCFLLRSKESASAQLRGTRADTSGMGGVFSGCLPIMPLLLFIAMCSWPRLPAGSHSDSRPPRKCQYLFCCYERKNRTISVF